MSEQITLRRYMSHRKKGRSINAGQRSNDGKRLGSQIRKMLGPGLMGAYAYMGEGLH